MDELSGSQSQLQSEAGLQDTQPVGGWSKPLSLKEMSKRFGRSPRTVRRYIKGKKSPSEKTESSELPCGD